MITKDYIPMALLLAAGVAPISAFAADTASTDASTREEIAALRRRIDELEKKTAGAPEPKAAVGPAPAIKESVSAKEPASVKFDEKGFAATCADKNFQLRIKGLVQLDARVFFDDGDSASSVDRFILRRARPIIEATIGKDYDIVMIPEFGDAPNTTPFMLDAYLNAAPFGKGVQFRAGKLRSAIGLEMIQSDPKCFFTERSLVTQLGSNRDLGVQIHGTPFDGILRYELGVYNGSPDGAPPSYVTEYDDSKSVGGRVFVRPFATGSADCLKNFGFGFGADYRDKTGTATTSGLASYRTDAQQIFYTWNAGVITDGKSVRYSPQAYWYAGPFGIMAEYLVSENAVSRPLGAGRLNDTIRNRGWQVSAGWVITGENAAYEGVVPANSIYNGGIGAWEIVARIADLRIDNDAFRNGFASTSGSASDARAYAVGLNWYPSVNLRFSAAYTHTDFDAVSPTSVLLRRGEDAVLMRAQISF